MPDEKLPLSRWRLFVRITGTVMLTACAVLVVLGQTVWADRFHGPQYLLFWSWCFLLAVIAVIFAMADMVLVRRAYRQSRRELLRKELEDLTKELRSRQR